MSRIRSYIPVFKGLFEVLWLIGLMVEAYPAIAIQQINHFASQARNKGSLSIS